MRIDGHGGGVLSACSIAAGDYFAYRIRRTGASGYLHGQLGCYCVAVPVGRPTWLTL